MSTAEELINDYKLLSNKWRTKTDFEYYKNNSIKELVFTFSIGLLTGVLITEVLNGK